MPSPWPSADPLTPPCPNLIKKKKKTQTLTPSFPPLQDSCAACCACLSSFRSGVWCLQVPASYKRHILMGLPLLCLIAHPPPPLVLTSATTPTLSLCWPLANPWRTEFRVRAADSQPNGRLPRGADAVETSETPGPLWCSWELPKKERAAVCVYNVLDLIRFREGRSDARACTERDERAVQCINKCRINRRMPFFYWTQQKKNKRVMCKVQESLSKYNQEESFQEGNESKRNIYKQNFIL